MILIDVLSLTDETVDDAQKVETVGLFAQMLYSLFVQDSDRRKVRSMLATGAADLEHFVGLAQAMVEHWMPEQSNRETRRATAAGAPAATRRKATARPASRR